MKINVCIASGDVYWNYMATAIVSILKTSLPSDEFHFYILCNQVEDKYKEYLKTLKKFKDFEVTFFDIDMREFEKFPNAGKHITNATYFRYKIAELCPDIDKMIYLDCDVIVNQSLSELFSTDLTGYYLGGVEDVGYYYWKNYNPDFIYKDGFYINAGMLLINLDAWRKNNLFKKFVEFTLNEASKIAIGDQDVINQVCKGKIKQLDYKWNVQDSFYRAEPERANNPNCEQIIEAANNPAVIHYTNSRKPWSDLNMPKALLWLYFDCIRTGSWFGYLKYCFDKIYTFIYLNILRNIFSVRNVEDKKVITIFFMKLKVKRRKK